MTRLPLPNARASDDRYGRTAGKRNEGGTHPTETKVRMAMAGDVACAECPLRKDSKPGYLGGYSPDMYLEAMLSPASIACHSSKGFDEHNIATQKHCYGVSAFRANVGWIAGRILEGANGSSMLQFSTAHESTQKVGPDDRFFEDAQAFYDHHEKGQTENDPPAR